MIDSSRLRGGILRNAVAVAGSASWAFPSRKGGFLLVIEILAPMLLDHVVEPAAVAQYRRIYERGDKQTSPKTKPPAGACMPSYNGVPHCSLFLFVITDFRSHSKRRQPRKKGKEGIASVSKKCSLENKGDLYNGLVEISLATFLYFFLPRASAGPFERGAQRRTVRTAAHTHCRRSSKSESIIDILYVSASQEKKPASSSSSSSRRGSPLLRSGTTVFVNPIS